MKEVYVAYDTREDTRKIINIFSNRKSAEKCLLDYFPEQAIEADAKWCGMSVKKYKKALIDPNNNLELMGYVGTLEVYDSYPLENK